MPRYFFHLRQGDQMLQDIEGQELRDADEAWEAVKAAAASLMKHEFERPVNWAETVFEVQDEAGEIVMEFPCLEAVEVKSQPHEGSPADIPSTSRGRSLKPLLRLGTAPQGHP